MRTGLALTTRAFRIPAAAMLLLGGVSCAPVGPDYVRPPVEVPSVFREKGDSKAADAKAPLPRSRWWELFADPDLNALVEQVDVGNQSIQAAEARVRPLRDCENRAGAIKRQGSL